MHTLIAYQSNSTAALSAVDMTALIDQTLSTRNSHYFFTAPMQLLGVSLFAATGNRASILSPTINAYGKFNVWPLNSSTIPASPPRMDLWIQYPPSVPTGEEIQAQVNTTGADTTTMIMVLAPPSWNANIPRGIGPFPIFEVRFTSAVTMNAQAWSTLAAVTFEQSLRTGTYAVVGCQLQGTGLLAFRMVFSRAPYYQGIQLRPGTIATAAIGDQPLSMGAFGPFIWGEWGRFSTVELPQIEALGVGTGAITAEGRMWIVRVSDSLDVMYNMSP